MSDRQRSMEMAARIFVEACAEILGQEPPAQRAYTADERARFAAECFSYAAGRADGVEIRLLMAAMETRQANPGAQAHNEALGVLDAAKVWVRSYDR